MEGAKQSKINRFGLFMMLNFHLKLSKSQGFFEYIENPS